MLYVPRHLSNKLEYKVLRERQTQALPERLGVKDVFGIFFLGSKFGAKTQKDTPWPREAPWRFENFEFMDISETLSA